MYKAKNAETLTARLKAEGADKPEIIRQLSALCIGWPYVWASQGEMCTPKWRRNRIPYCREQKYADMIRDNCPVLSDGVVSCAGCKWDGVQIARKTFGAFPDMTPAPEPEPEPEEQGEQ